MVFSIQNRFSSPKTCLIGANDALDYLKEPSDKLSILGHTYIAAKLDQSVQRVYNQFEELILKSPEHAQRVSTLKKMERTSGPYSKKKEIFSGVSCLEQMVAVKEWLDTTHIRKIHTFFLSVHYGKDIEDYVPVWVMPPNNQKDPDIFNIMLGSKSGRRKAGRYTDWAINDPWDDRYQSTMALMLDHLEMARQPHYSSSTILKGNAYELDLITNEWRYGVFNHSDDVTSGFKPEACVELEGQRNGHKTHKKQSASHNFVKLLELMPDDDDDFCYPIRYEKFTDRNRDEVEIHVSPSKIQKGLIESINKKNDGLLDEEMFKLTVGKINTPSTASVIDLISKKLFFTN